MDEPAQKIAVEYYWKNVKWLREHIAPDDIYEFAQQAVMASEYFIGKLHESTDISESVKADPMMAHWIHNIFSLHKMKEDGFQGIVNVSWRLDK